MSLMIMNGWPIMENKSDGVYYYPGGTLFSKEQIFNLPEPDFVLPIEYSKKIVRFCHTTQLFNYDSAKIGGYMPSSPVVIEYLEHAKKPPKDKIIPGLGTEKAYSMINMYGQYLVKSFRKELYNMKAEITAKKIIYTEVPFREGIYTVELPWDEVTPCIDDFSVEKCPQKYVQEVKKHHFGHFDDLQKMYYNKSDGPLSSTLRYYGWGDDYAYIIEPLYRNKFRLFYRDEAPYSVYGTEFKEFFGVRAEYKIVEFENYKALKKLKNGKELFEVLSF